GRFYAMDRDFRWERVALAYDALTGRATLGKPAPTAVSAGQAIERYYAAPISPTQGGDEFVTPTMIGRDPAQTAAGRIRSGDSVIFYNYRGDRPRELAMAFVLDDAGWAKVKASPDSGRPGFARGERIDTWFVAMTAWSADLAPRMHVASGRPPRMPMIAGEYWSSLGLRQFRCAETEKYPHVTFFFNDYREEPFPGETRSNPQSPKDVNTYDQRPEMAALEVRDRVLSRLAAPDTEDVLIVNFANCDMVGHTGNLKAAVAAVETTDACVGAIIEAVLARGGSLIVTADHGNAEQMFDPEANSPHTAHTFYDVPLYVIGAAFKGRRLRGDTDLAFGLSETARASRGRLADVVPTALAMMGLAQPPEMTGQSLLI
ncbi:MAG: alkaline phosphatase family protein, partial [Phycisphaerales bacterium]